MVHGPSHLRFQVHPSTAIQGMWAVVDVFTGLPVILRLTPEGVPLDCMTAQEAEDMVYLMNYQDLDSRRTAKPSS